LVTLLFYHCMVPRLTLSHPYVFYNRSCDCFASIIIEHVNPFESMYHGLSFDFSTSEKVCEKTALLSSEHLNAMKGDKVNGQRHLKSTIFQCTALLFK
jgi:hypothetical protein